MSSVAAVLRLLRLLHCESVLNQRKDVKLRSKSNKNLLNVLQVDLKSQLTLDVTAASNLVEDSSKDGADLRIYLFGQVTTEQGAKCFKAGQIDDVGW